MQILSKLEIESISGGLVKETFLALYNMANEPDDGKCKHFCITKAVIGTLVTIVCVPIIIICEKIGHLTWFFSRIFG